MAWFEDAETIRGEIAELRAMLDAQTGLTADARANVLSTLLSARTTLLAIETFHAHKDGIKYDVIAPLTMALTEFKEPANRLAAAIEQHMPEY